MIDWIKWRRIELNADASLESSQCQRCAKKGRSADWHGAL